MTFAMSAPLVAQLMMMAIMAAQGQWLYALMILPGAVGCLASVLVSLPGMKPADGDAMPARTSTSPLGAHAQAAGLAAGNGSKQPDIEAFRGIATMQLEELLHVDPLAWRTIVAHWSSTAQWEVPIGMTADRSPFTVDLRRHGPHALVAGTTGSGKSVLLQSWCLALAACNGPDRLHFVFLDFKGGSAFHDLERLPHCAGSVSDLNLAHASRALRALEAELTRREWLTAEHRTAYIDDLPSPPPRLVVVIDEFHALKDQLPDYINRLVRIASLGRSLGMHLIACTQNPMGQVDTDMKANMALNICLRVRDELQSAELLGDGRAARISPAMPGAAYCNDGEQVRALRCSPIGDIAGMSRNIAYAARFMAMEPASPLFSAPLPTAVRQPGPSGRDLAGVWIGVADDGITLHDAHMDVTLGNIGVIGGHGRGKSTILEIIAKQVSAMDGALLRISRSMHGIRHTQTVHAPARAIRLDTAPSPPRQIWLVDDADDLFEPFLADEQAINFRQALANPAISVVFAVSSMRHVRVPEHCSTRIVFPSGEKTADLMAGIPSALLASLTANDFDTPGRAVLITGVSAQLMQCAS
ncbi:cell division protein FtsK [Bifidobacterium felsineum]|uniref:Cell division protein FtsK n=2 Tax=Bifidobacterium felsineum TaxID=2045440 RepID=A0A2M9HL44_9BIFI|nr:cell division protein FtsK [Bifidobacterium felsineum]